MPLLINQPPRFHSSMETRLCIDRLKEMIKGELVPYEEWNQLTGLNVQYNGPGGGYNILLSARTICLRDYQVVTDAVRGVGIKRLIDKEAIDEGGHGTFLKIRRVSKKGVAKIQATNFMELPNDYRLKHNAALSLHGVMRLIASPKTLDRVNGAVNTTQTGKLAVGLTMEFLRRLNKREPS